MTGVVNGESQWTATSGQPALSTTVTSKSKPGTYPFIVKAGTLAAANYSFVYVNGDDDRDIASASAKIPVTPVEKSATPEEGDQRPDSGLRGVPQLIRGRDVDEIIELKRRG
jgi:hypothetical protein